MGSVHPKYQDMQYPINYGYIEGILAGDCEAQDAYILGVDKPLQSFEGTVIAVIHRKDDVEDKWVVAPVGLLFTEEEILQSVNFQEKFYNVEIIR